MDTSLLLRLLAPAVIIGPVVGFIILALIGTTRFRRDEKLVTRIVAVSVLVSLVAAVISVVPLVLNAGGAPVEIVHFPLLPGLHEPLGFGLFIDKLNVPFIILTALLSGLVGFFSRPYVHRDPSHYRFFLLLLLFVVGMQLLLMGSSFRVLFIGWEIVGLSSALLISFYYMRKEPIEGALRAFLLYRLGDTALLLSSAILSTHFRWEQFSGIRNIIDIPTHPFPAHSTLGVILLVLIITAASIKSAQFPFSSWLPRAMEGPTPSSAIFYGGLAVHAGFYLVLRLSSEFLMPTWFNISLIAIGAISALYGGLVGRMQCDIKGALAFASLSQVGLMFIEVALGLRALAIIHFVGHASFRTFQILSAGSLIHEARPRRDSAKAEAQGEFIPAWIRSAAFDLGAGYRGALTPILRTLELIGSTLAVVEERWFGIFSGVLTQSSERNAAHKKNVTSDLHAKTL